MAEPVDLKKLGISPFDLGVPIRENILVAPLKPVIFKGDHGGTLGIVVHPTDYIWLKHHDDPAKAHEEVMAWIERRAEEMAVIAIRRLQGMFLHQDDFGLAHG